MGIRFVLAAALFACAATPTAAAEVSEVSGPCALPNTGVNLSEGPTNWANCHPCA